MPQNPTNITIHEIIQYCGNYAQHNVQSISVIVNT